MKKIFQNIFLWIYLKIHSILINISIALYNTEVEILKANPFDLKEGDKRIQRMRHRNQLLEEFYAGKKNDKYTELYYDILKKSEKFIKTASPHKMAVAADKYHTSYGMKDQYGRRYEHYGFFDEGHRYAGKCISEVLELEKEERRTKDDDYELLYIFNNIPIEVGLGKVFDVVEKTNKEDVDFEYEVQDMVKKSKQFEFPIKIFREKEEVVNKIEQLTEFLHVKKIGFEYRQLEFFIPLKFKTTNLSDDSDIFKDILNISEVSVKNEYGELIGFKINEYSKRIVYNNTHEVIKFNGIEMENMGTI